MHVAVNIVGTRRCCSVVLMLSHRRQWGHRFDVCRPCLRLFPVKIDCYTLLIFQINSFAIII